MPDDNTTETVAAEATATVAAAAETVAPVAEAAKVFTQEQVNAIAADARRAGRAERKPEPAKATPDHLLAKITELEQRGAYTKRTAKLDLDDDQEATLFEVYKASPAAFDKMVALIGVKPATQVASVQAPVLPAAAAPSAPARVGGLTQGGITDLFTLDATALNALGPLGVRAAFEQILAIGQQMNGAPPMPKTTRK